MLLKVDCPGVLRHVSQSLRPYRIRADQWDKKRRGFAAALIPRLSIPATDGIQFYVFAN